jgi:hypothetical protein
MTMTPRVRKFALTTHVTSSVGWLGAVAGFLALAVAGVTSADAHLVRAAYLSMHLITWFVIVPFSVAALATGLVQSLGTPWGVFRHYWVVAKLALTVVATLILLARTQPIGQVASVASQTMLASGDLRQLRIQLIADAGAALMSLLVATTLSVYKPWGMTVYGRRDDSAARRVEPVAASRARWRWFWLVGILAVVALFAYLHLGGVSIHGH